MPEIAPVLPTMPGAQAPASGASLLPAAPVAADGSIADFLGQLTAAQEGLANAVSPLPTGLARAQTLARQAASADSAPTPTAPEPAVKTSDTHSDQLLELLASLGFVVVPPALQPQVGDAAEGSSSKLVDRTPVLAGSPLTPSGPVAQPRQTTPPADAAPTADGSKSSTPDLPASSTLAPAPVVREQAPLADRLNLPSAVAASSPTVVQLQPGQGSAPQSGDGSDSHQHRSNRILALDDSTPVDATAPASIDQSFNAAVAQASTPTGAPIQTTAAHPAEVVSQIVHQAELYRLPGNRGVRIQLHPDDLGGVQVTVRYGVGGGLELHINVEHAATGALVQAGWTELRDALATHGISPDRLVMSVTPPENAKQLDFSSNGGGAYRSDSGLAQFGQGGQSDRQRQDGGDDARFSRVWDGRLEATPAADDGPRIASSHIDYRV